jgi:hypothetical protein
MSLVAQVYPRGLAGGNASVNGGYLQSTNATYATARAGSSPVATKSGRLFIGQFFSSPNYSCYESCVEFDTSFLGSGATITSAVMKHTSIVSLANTGSNFVIQARNLNYGTFSSASYVAGASVSAPIVATYNTTGGAGAGTWTDAGGSAVQGMINKTGMTKVQFTSDRFVAGTVPTGDEYVQFIQTLYIEITYTQSSSPVTLPVLDSTKISAIISGDTAGNYANVRAGTGTQGKTVSYPTSLPYVGQQDLFDAKHGTTQYYLYQMIMGFDTSWLSGVLIGGNVLQSVTLKLYGVDTGTTYVKARKLSGAPAWTTADWNTNPTALTLLASNNNGSANDTYLTLNDVAMVANVNTSGITYIQLFSDDFETSTAPGANTFSAYRIASVLDGAPPELIITYGVPGSVVSRNVITNQAVKRKAIY